MRTTKLFFMAALALTLTACSSDDNDLNIAPQPRQAGGITITAQLAPKTGGTDTRAVADNGDNQITVTWAVNEHIAVLYTKDETQYAADATVTAVDGDGAATITFTVETGTPDNTPCTLVYPYDAAKDDHSGVKDAATLLAAQDGTLSANLDIRVGAGTIQTSTPGLTVTTQPAAQYAIFKFTTKTSNGGATIDVTSLTVTTGGQDYVITLASATSELYAVLPPISGQEVTFTATGSDSKTYTASKASVSFDAGKYYQSIIKLTEVPAATLVTSITLNKTATEIKVGSTETLSVTAVAPDNATDKTYTWKTSDESKATVDQDGKVTAVAAGTVTIYAEANDGSGVKGNCTVTVTPATITVTWNNDDITGEWGTTFTKDGVTITADMIDFNDKNFMGGGTFSTTLGNFTKIEVSSGYCGASGTGWSGNSAKKTWTGNASSVSFSGDIMGMGMGTTKLVFTIEPTN